MGTIWAVYLGRALLVCRGTGERVRTHDLACFGAVLDTCLFKTVAGVGALAVRTPNHLRPARGPIYSVIRLGGRLDTLKRVGPAGVVRAQDVVRL